VPALRLEADLCEAFSLTPIEARAALLLAQGKPNAEVADALSISPHTARRHTERVLYKLGARSRAEVAVRLLL
jgi:DNA-binding CsgD family transcriptional regulator